MDHEQWAEPGPSVPSQRAIVNDLVLCRSPCSLVGRFVVCEGRSWVQPPDIYWLTRLGIWCRFAELSSGQQIYACWPC